MAKNPPTVPMRSRTKEYPFKLGKIGSDTEKKRKTKRNDETIVRKQNAIETRDQRGTGKKREKELKDTMHVQ